MIAILLAGIIPAIFLLRFGSSRRPKGDDPSSLRKWAAFLFLGLSALMAAVLITLLLPGELDSIIVLILLPSLLALAAESIFYWLQAAGALAARQVGRYFTRQTALFLLVLLLLGGIGLRDRSIFVLIPAGGALLAAGWLAWRKMDAWMALTYPLLLALLLAAVWLADTQSDLAFLPGWLSGPGRALAYIAPGLGIVFLFRLLGWAVEGRRRTAAAVLLTLPVLALIAWQTVTGSAWDVATDGLHGVFMMQLAAGVGVGAGILAGWNLPPWRYTLVFGLSLLVVGLVGGAATFGTFGLDGAWGNVPHARTERRAGAVNRAILAYYQREGRYPAALEDLTPAYLLYLPTPFIIPGQGWCYEGGEGYYRLGYVTRDYFSTPASVKVFASVGAPPDEAWPCDAEAAMYPGE